ncbi:hypothetical protein GCM10023350_09570 [Nocardioides endophyticus]|uniref:Periplasmic binding protein domain-containing protein n=1 Tax=Nocardioides endophyticus TaxID=1353775 RepID=A0ABP8YGT1_9ACTN
MRRVITSAAVLAVIGSALVGCGSSDDSGSSGDGEAASTSQVAVAAQDVVKPYLAAPSEFPITEPLKGSAAGKKIAYLDSGTPVSALELTFAQEAAKKLGMTVDRIDAGFQADSIQNAFDTVLAKGYDGVIDAGLPMPLAERGLQDLADAGTPAVGFGLGKGDKSLVPVSQSSDVANRKAGAVLADYVVATYGEDVDTVYYYVPEIESTRFSYEAFSEEVEKLCSTCKVRSAEIPIADLGTKAPSDVIADLQAHPDTKQAAFAVGEMAIGLPAAMKTSGLEVDTVTVAPGQDSLQQIKDGDMRAGVGFDFTFIGWAQVDSLARLVQGQAPSQAVLDDVIPMQVITQDSVTDDMVKDGWSGFPDIADRFDELWSKALAS